MAKPKVARYEGGNEYMDHLVGDDVLWIVSGDRGRLILIADTAEEALVKYAAKPKKNYSTLFGNDEV